MSKKPRDIDLQQNVYEVERIDNHRGSAGKYEYYVKWKGYHEPESSFRDTALINDYWKSR